MTFNQGVGGSIPPCLRREKRLKLSSYKGLSLFIVFVFSPDFDDFGENKCIIFATCIICASQSN